MAVTEKGKRTLMRGVGLLVVVGAVLGLRYAAQTGLGRQYLPAFMVPKIALDDQATDTRFRTASNSAVAFVGLPSKTAASLPTASTVRVKWWAWNAQLGCNYANGGATTTEGSLMAKAGIRMNIKREDDNGQLAAELYALAKALHGGETDPTTGIMFTGIMGDGAWPFLSDLNKRIVKDFGPDYRAEIVGSCGYSRGEDKLMGPETWQSSPKSMKGAVIAGVIRDGDWNIAVRYAGDNDVGINPDETTYDPDLINFVNAKDYIDAAQKFVSGYSEDRKVVHSGKPTGETKHVTVQGAVTWTPGDVIMATGKGGVISVISTKEYANEMPHVIIGVHRYNQTHKDVVTKMLAAFGEGGNQVLNHPQALDRAAEISSDIYAEKGTDAAYWKKYYIGVTEPDRTGMKVSLGGSKANNLADALLVFGLTTGTTPNTSRFYATFTAFGNISHAMYPKLVDAVPAIDSIVDLSYLQAAATLAGSNMGKAELPVFTQTSAKLNRVVGSRNVQINFATGKSTLTAQGEAQLEQLYIELTTNNLTVEVHGHTDNVGDPTMNKALSEERAIAIKTWLENKSATNFPSGRVRVYAHGDESPIASNVTDAGRAKNRRVEIVIGQ